MNNLQAQIAADENSSTSLKADVQSITRSYRIYMSVVPQADIEAAADRAMTIDANLVTIGTKLQARVSALGSSAPATVISAMADYNAKVADANTQAQTAVSEVSGLTPDQGIRPKCRRITLL